MKIHVTGFRLVSMKGLWIVLLLFPLVCNAQVLSEERLLSGLTNGAIPEEVMSKRSAVVYGIGISSKDVNTIHESFVRTGIDAVAYFETEKVLAGGDTQRAYSKYLNKREIACLIFIQKKQTGFEAIITLYNGKVDFINAGQAAWRTQASTLSGLMNEIYRQALNAHRKKNLLINDVAETDLPIVFIEGNRNETYAYDLKIDNMAVPLFVDSASNRELESIFKSYPLRYQLTDNSVAERDLRNKGFLYILCVVHARSAAAKQLLGYPVNESESAFVSVSYTGDKMELKKIPADVPVYKFYVRHIDSGNVFLSPKWDADPSWQQALQNFIKGLKAEMKL